MNVTHLVPASEAAAVLDRQISKPKTIKVRFTSKLFTPRTFPDFAYVASGIQPIGIVFTAVIEDATPEEVIEKIEDAFGREVEIHTMLIGVNGFSENDAMPGARTYGTIRPAMPKLGLIKRIWAAIAG